MEEDIKKCTKRPWYQTINNIIIPAYYSSKHFKEALEYKPMSNDVFIWTYPKSGTTWMQNVALYIFRKGKELDDMSLFLKYCPYIDMCGKESIGKMPRPGVFKTHFNYSQMPYSPEAKYIVVVRNPKDCVVSLFHHTANQFGVNYCDGQFDDFFELFMAGEVMYNDYFDHLLSWYPYRNNSNIFYTTYEEMKRDIRLVIMNVASFLGKEYSDAVDKDNAVLHNIMRFSGFEYMQKHLSSLYDTFPKNVEILEEPGTYEGFVYVRRVVSKMDLPSNISKWQFVRKGIVGDWKNVLIEEQNERLSEKFLIRTRGTDIPDWLAIS